jgi:serine/threonine protein kinase
MAIVVSIEGYDSLEQIGVGGMAAVYKARKVSIDKVVAIKVLFPYLASDESFIERFQREAKAAARIQHENIVNVIDFGESGGAYFIVMEYYEGRTLEDILKEHSHITLDIAVQILLEVCYGLEAAHALDIVHRDIKPGNVIYTRSGGIKIADFGLAKKSDSVTVITQQGKVIGTPAYMSPEQAAGRNVGPQSDIFSLGVVVYEMLGQKKPFDGKTYSEVLEKIQTHEPPSIAELNPLIQPDFEDIVRRMLEKDQSKRYQSIPDVIADLEKAMEKFQMPRDRRRLGAYIRDPVSYEAAFREITINRCLSQGTFYMKQGQSHLDEAIVEFKRILHLDPENERAKNYLQKLLSNRGTVTVAAAEAPPRRAERPRAERHTSVTLVAASGRRPRPRRTRRAVAAVLGLAVTGVGGWFAYQQGYLPIARFLGAGNRAPVLAAPERLAVRAGEKVEFALHAIDAEGDSIRFFCEDLPSGASLGPTGEFSWTVARDEEGTHRLKFYADDGQAASLLETEIDVQALERSITFEELGPIEIGAGKEFHRTLEATSSSGGRVTFRLVEGPRGMSVDGNKLMWKPGQKENGTFRAVIGATDGEVTERQTAVVKVLPAPEKPALARVEWRLPESADIYVDGKLRQRGAKALAADLGAGKHTLRAELLDGTNGWIEALDVKPGERLSIEAPRIAYGQLSVYFLGGVGEFRVNGKLFKSQPPFTAVPVPVGSHTVSVRMASESAPRELTIAVEPGRETVIEYEAGKAPVVTQVGP